MFEKLGHTEGVEPSAQEDVPSPKWRERFNALRQHGPLLFKMVWEAAPRVVVASLVARFMASLLPLAMLTVTGRIIQSIHTFTAHEKPLPHYFWWLVLVEFILASLATILVRVLDLCDSVLADKFTRHIGIRIVKHASTLDLSSYEDPVFYDKMERARAQGSDRLIMIQSAGRLLQQGITAASLAASILVFAPWILLILVACVIPAFLGETHFAFLGYSLNFKQTTARRQMEYLAAIGGSRESAKELKLFRLGPFIVQRYTDLSDELHRQNLVLAKRKLYFGALLTMLGTIGYYGTYAFVIYRTIAGDITLGTMTILAGAIAGASTNIQAFFSTFSIIADQALFMSDLFEFFAVQPKIRSKPGAVQAPRPIRQGFEFKDVCFHYPGNPRPVLDRVSFRIEPGARIALVGENGQGKTTIVKLITRLYDPTGGQILIDGVDLRDYNLDDLRKEIGVIFQDFTRYEMTASENIAVGQIEEMDNQFRIRSAANKSLAEKVIRKLPEGYNQTLGTRFEGSVNLSGGEWQKMALARAYLREAQLLILDEPAAALDARSEHEVFQRFAELTKGKMALLISHRFSTVRMADRILLLEKGRIAEQGRHDELVSGSGRYAEMFEMQAASYR
ncbi:MAG TPA: ABC transporter ATP-binding protein [Candidatus Acidoferrales bacterium]|jgi:ATP-binding cassette subfamily B protein|nr:ABC transporter ATP-binding protein [Candidatus Acidoferrales bacterium]